MVRFVQATHQMQECALAGTGFTGNCQKLARSDFQVHGIERDHRGIPLPISASYRSQFDHSTIPNVERRSAIANRKSQAAKETAVFQRFRLTGPAVAGSVSPYLPHLR